jgi:hypothetical protein
MSGADGRTAAIADARAGFGLRSTAGMRLLMCLGAVVLLAFTAVLVRLAYDVVIDPNANGESVKASWAFLAAALAAFVTFLGALFTHTQTERTNKRLEFDNARAEERFRLDTAVSGLKLLTAGDGSEYSTTAVVAGALATLLHLGHPVIAMRVLAACWDDGQVDMASATWLISEIFALDAPQAQIEASFILDVHAAELCHEIPGRFFWPAEVSDGWIPDAPLSARLRVLRAILTTVTSKDRQWWKDAGRQGWAVAVLREVLAKDPDADLKAHAAEAIRTMLPVLRQAGLVEIQTANAWIQLGQMESEVNETPTAAKRIVMLDKSLQKLSQWSQAVPSNEA